MSGRRRNATASCRLRPSTERLVPSFEPLWFRRQAPDHPPPLFSILAASGDLILGVQTLPMLRGSADPCTKLFTHLFGFADFVVAVGTGLTLTLLYDPRMAPIRDLPLTLIPLFGVGISQASHLIALHLLWIEHPAASVAGLATA